MSAGAREGRRPRGATFDTVLDNWFPLTYALDSLNRGLGLHRPLPVRAIAEGDRLVHEALRAHGDLGGADAMQMIGVWPPAASWPSPP